MAKVFFVLIMAVSILGGCGQTGALYLPKDANHAQTKTKGVKHE